MWGGGDFRRFPFYIVIQSYFLVTQGINFLLHFFPICIAGLEFDWLPNKVHKSLLENNSISKMLFSFYLRSIETFQLVAIDFFLTANWCNDGTKAKKKSCVQGLFQELVFVFGPQSQSESHSKEPTIIFVVMTIRNFILLLLLLLFHLNLSFFVKSRFETSFVYCAVYFVFLLAIFLYVSLWSLILFFFFSYALFFCLEPNQIESEAALILSTMNADQLIN